MDPGEARSLQVVMHREREAAADSLYVAKGVGAGAEVGDRSQDIEAVSLLLATAEAVVEVDFDMALLVIASGLYRPLARRMRGCRDAPARQIFRDLIDMPADTTISKEGVRVAFHRRAHLPIIHASGLLDQPLAVPW